jgi:uncharacterized protein (DUF2147 family)
MKIIGVILAGGLLAASSAGVSGATEATGVWRMESGKVTVRLANCGARLCGTIIALKKPFKKNGQPKTDHENPNPALRDRPLIGLLLLSNMKPDGENKWRGTIYNPDDGRTYSASMRLDGNRIKVKGCVAGILCQSKWFVKVD